MKKFVFTFLFFLSNLILFAEAHSSFAAAHIITPSNQFAAAHPAVREHLFPQAPLFSESHLFAETLPFSESRLFAASNQAADTLIVDLDLDQKSDSIFYDHQHSRIICKLSTQNFAAITTDSIKYTDQMSHISLSPNGFKFTNEWMREGYHCEFAYNKNQRKIQLVRIDRYAFGPANNDGSGESHLNLLTNEYEGKWNYYEERKEQLIELPVLKEKIVLPTTYLQGFNDSIFRTYEAACIGYMTEAKNKRITDSKTQIIRKSFIDINGKNTLQIKLLNPCILDTPPWDADKCTIEATLTNKKMVSKLFYDYPDAQMSLIYLVEKEIEMKKINGTTAIFIPFYYCGAMEDFDRKVSYFIFYSGKKHTFHLDYNCKDDQNCKVVQNLNATLKALPAALKTDFIKYLNHKHQSIKSFHQE